MLDVDAQQGGRTRAAISDGGCVITTANATGDDESVAHALHEGGEGGALLEHGAVELLQGADPLGVERLALRRELGGEVGLVQASVVEQDGGALGDALNRGEVGTVGQLERAA